MTTRDGNDYLWNPDAAPDPDVQRLEALLSPLRSEEPLRAATNVPVSSPISALKIAVPMAVAASIAVLIGASVLGGRGAAAVQCEATAPETPWAVIPDRGAPRCGDATLRSAVRLAEGRTVETGAGDSATIRVADIGSVAVRPNTRVRLLETRSDEHRLELERGEIHAVINAPPRLFMVQTASATAVDLGCEYTLAVDERGNGVLHVSFGYVSLEDGDRSAWVPAGAKCRTREGIGPGTPYYEGADPRLVEALTRFDFHGDTAVIAEILELARENDAITLWHLIPRVDAARQVAVYERLAQLAPPPDDVRREDVLRGDQQAMESWRLDIEVVGFNPAEETE